MDIHPRPGACSGGDSGISSPLPVRVHCKCWVVPTQHKHPPLRGLLSVEGSGSGNKVFFFGLSLGFSTNPKTHWSLLECPCTLSGAIHRRGSNHCFSYILYI